jgi:hypothetical protein
MLASRYFPFSGIRIAQSPAVNCQGDGTVDNYYFTPPFQFSGPSVGVVATGGTLFFSPFPSIIVPNDVLAMLPSSPDLSAPNLVVTRFTAPTTDVFNITGSFTDLQRASVVLRYSSMEVIAFNSSFTGSSAFQGTIPFSISDVSLSAGMAIDFTRRNKGLSSLDDLVGKTIAQRE